MNDFNRIFGSGPIGLLISITLLIISFYLKDLFNIPQILDNQNLISVSIFVILAIVSVSIIIWSLVSLNPRLRGKVLITTGALKYFRHPLYAAFLTFFNFGLAFLLNNWIFIIWAFLLHPVWHLLVIKEENDLKITFPDEYEKYCKNTGRFVPRFYRKTRRHCI